MCKCVIKLCTGCTTALSKWSECNDFVQFKSNPANVDCEPNSDEWVSKHGTTDPPRIVVDIVTCTCPSCKNANRKKSSTHKLVASVEEVAKPLAGTFRLLNSDGKQILPAWLKKIHEPVKNDIETETETETESEDDNETDNTPNSATPFPTAHKT